MNKMSNQQRIVLIVSVMASFVSGLDGFIVNVALPAIAYEFGGGLIIEQWVINAYMLTLGSFMLIAGSLSDLFGRKKILTIGIVGFGVTSLLCALAPSGESLIIARALQGIAGALLVPSSLALIMSHFSGSAQSRAIGIWTAWTVVAPAVAPFIGGVLVDAASWRWIFAINVLPIAAGLWMMSKLKESPKPKTRPAIDFAGTWLCVIGLGAITFAFIEQPAFGWTHPLIYLTITGGILVLAAFLWYERRGTTHPMLPMKLFKIHNFSVGNIVTFTIYGGLSVSIFLITIFLQQVGHYSALAAGLATVPVTILMFVLSPYFGKLAGTYGPKLFMGLGPIIIAMGFLSMLRLDQSVNYWTQLLPGIILFGLGLSITVAPLTSAILGSINKAQSGIGSAINNAVARIAGLIMVAILGFAIGSELSVEWFHRGVILIAILLGAGGIISLIGIRNHEVKSAETGIQTSKT